MTLQEGDCLSPICEKIPTFTNSTQRMDAKMERFGMNASVTFPIDKHEN